MAVTNSPRLGLNRWSSGNDPHPNRAEQDEQQRLLDQTVAVDVEVPTFADRPVSPIARCLMWVTSEKALYRWSGTAWERIAPLGGVTPKSVLVGGNSIEGTSVQGARADHQHAIPLATSTTGGALSAEDKDKLDRSTASATENSLVQRDSAGGSSVTSMKASAAPVDPSHVTRKDYVDAQDAASLARANQYSDQVSTRIMATLGTALLQGTVAVDLNNVRTPGLYRAGSGSASTENNYPASVGGSLLVSASVGSGDVVQTYVGEGGAIWVRSFVGGVWGSWKAIGVYANATQSAAGLMSSTDKRLLDNASALTVTNALVQRDASGQIAVVTPPTAANQATSKSYVDSQTSSTLAGANSYTDDVGNRKVSKELSLGSGDLNSVTATGQYHQSNTNNVTTANNYPTGAKVGMLLVWSNGQSLMLQVTQQYLDLAGRTWVRARADGTWSAWAELASTALATQSAAGLMSTTDKTKLDSAGIPANGGTIVQRDGTGQITVPATPSVATSASSKSYVDTLTSAFWDNNLGNWITGESSTINTLTTPGRYSVRNEVAGVPVFLGWRGSGMLDVYTYENTVRQVFTVTGATTGYVPGGEWGVTDGTRDAFMASFTFTRVRPSGASKWSEWEVAGRSPKVPVKVNELAPPSSFFGFKLRSDAANGVKIKSGGSWWVQDGYLRNDLVVQFPNLTYKDASNGSAFGDFSAPANLRDRTSLSIADTPNTLVTRQLTVKNGDRTLSAWQSPYGFNTGDTGNGKNSVFTHLQNLTNWELAVTTYAPSA